MELKQNSRTYNDKTYTSYRVSTLNAEGQGLPARTAMLCKLVFDPKIKKGFSPKVKAKSDSNGNNYCIVTATVTWLNLPSECKSYLNEYNNLTLDLPKNSESVLSSMKKNDEFVLSVKTISKMVNDAPKKFSFVVAEPFIPLTEKQMKVVAYAKQNQLTIESDIEYKDGDVMKTEKLSKLVPNWALSDNIQSVLAFSPKA